MMQPFLITAQQLAKIAGPLSKDGDHKIVAHTYRLGSVGYQAKHKVFHDYRGDLVICQRCGGAVRGLVEAPQSRGVCCIGCYARAKHALDAKEDRQSSRKRDTKPASPVKSGQGKAKGRGRGKAITLPAKTPNRRAA